MKLFYHILVNVFLGAQILLEESLASPSKPSCNLETRQNCPNMDGRAHFFCEMARKRDHGRSQQNNKESIDEWQKKWNELDQSEKARYAEIAEQDTKRQDEIRRDKIEKKKRLDAEKAVGRPLSSFAWFCKEERALVEQEIGEEPRQAEVARELLKRWSSLDVERKSKYLNLETKDKEVFEQKINSYIKNHAKDSKYDDLYNYYVVGEEYDTDEDYEEEQRKSVPTGSKMSGYAFFVDKMRREHQKNSPEEKINFNEFSKKCTDEWKALTEAEKLEFSFEAQLESKRFNDKEAAKAESKVISNRGIKRVLKAFDWYEADEGQKVLESLDTNEEHLVEKELLKRWNSLDRETRSKYELYEKDDRNRFERELAVTKASSSKS